MRIRDHFDEFKKAVKDIENPYPDKVLLRGPIIFGDGDAIGFIIDFLGVEGELLMEGTIHWRIEDTGDGSLLITDAVGYNQKLSSDMPTEKIIKALQTEWEFYLNEAIVL
jgi:hypothetical protein